MGRSCQSVYTHGTVVSMKSGLEGRNNARDMVEYGDPRASLNEVRPRRPEQYVGSHSAAAVKLAVSMKSGLEGRNNPQGVSLTPRASDCLNEVRPRRPEQYVQMLKDGGITILVSMKSGLEGRNNVAA